MGLLVSQIVQAARRNPHLGRDLIVRLNKSILNPAMLRFAGKGNFYAALIHHVGRRSGRSYVTPIVAEPVAEGFLIPLPYGADTDWCRNVRTAGTAIIDHKGVRSTIVAPALVDANVALPQLSPKQRRVYKALHISEFLAVRRIADRVVRTGTQLMAVCQ